MYEQSTRRAKKRKASDKPFRFASTISYGKKKPTKGAFGNKNKKKPNNT